MMGDLQVREERCLTAISVYLSLSLNDTHTQIYTQTVGTYQTSIVILEDSSYLFSKVKCSTVSFGVLPKTSEGFSNYGIIWLLESLEKTQKTDLEK